MQRTSQMRFENTNLFIRADADSKIGFGHLMRCLALAQCWKKQQGNVTFITKCDNEALLDRIKSEGFHIVNIERSFPDPSDWVITEKVLAESYGSWLVCDGYQFDSSFHRNVKKSGSRLLVIDDTVRLKHYYADILLNQNGHAKNLNYSCERHTSLLLGHEYVMLRDEYRKKNNSRCSAKKKVRKILVTMGGSDPRNQTLKFLKLINEIKPKDIEVVIVTGVSNPNISSLQLAVCRAEVSFQLSHASDDMADIMSETDIAISAGGSTCWELAFMGIPMLVVIAAVNQQGIAAFLAEKGISVNLGWSDSLVSENFIFAFEKLVSDYKVRERMSISGRQLIDGKGTVRIVNKMMG